MKLIMDFLQWRRSVRAKVWRIEHPGKVYAQRSQAQEIVTALERGRYEDYR